MGQPPTEGEARLRVKVLAEGRVGGSLEFFETGQLLESKFGFAKRSAGVEQVAGPRSRAPHGLSRGDFAKNRYADEEAFAACCVAAGECASRGAGGATQAAQKIGEPWSREWIGERQAEQKAGGLASHSGDIADGAGEAFPADGIGGMFGPEEVSAFEEPIASQDRILVIGPAPKRGIVAAREDKGPRARRAEGALDGLDDVLFILRFAHGERLS